ncbi:hypothetical protein VPH35_061553 [Triticum aestivum]
MEEKEKKAGVKHWNIKTLQKQQRRCSECRRNSAGNLDKLNMVLKLSGTQRQGVPKRGGSPPPRGRTTSLYRSGYYRSGVVQDDMAVPPATYLGHGAGGGGGTAASSASSTPAWERPPNGGQGEAAVREWVAQVEPGVQITFVSLAGGAGNDLKRIRFSREMYYKWQAQRWCGDNNERIMELYNVRRFTHQVLPDPPRDDDAAEVSVTGTLCADGAIVVHRCLRLKDLFAAEGVVLLAVAGGLDDGQPSATTGAGPGGPGGAARQHSFRGPLSPPPPSSSNPSERAWQQQQQQHPQRPEPDVPEPTRTTTSSMPDDVSISNASELEVTELVIQDEPGVYITVRELADGARELRRVRFSREKFAELNAKLWWEENKERIHAQYL